MLEARKLHRAALGGADGSDNRLWLALRIVMVVRKRRKRKQIEGGASRGASGAIIDDALKWISNELVGMPVSCNSVRPSRVTSWLPLRTLITLWG